MSDLSDFFNREASAIGPGVASGLDQARQETWQGIKGAGRDLNENWAKSTGSYLRDHAPDFAIGAAISMLAPKGWATKALAAWSLHGLCLPLVHAGWQARDPDANINDIRKSLTGDLAHQTALMASALPMSLAGGIAGRGTANILLGEGKTLPDLLSGDVKPADVACHSSNFAGSLLGNRAKAVVTDLDDTLFPLKPYLAQSFKTNVEMIANKMELPQSEVIRMIGPQKMNPWLLETSELARKFKGTPQQFQEQIVKPFWQNDAAAMEQSMMPFASVTATLQQLEARGVKVVGLTNMPAALAMQRLDAAGLSKYFPRVYAIKIPEPALSDVVSFQSLQHGQDMVSRANVNNSAATSAIRIVGMPESWQKPNVQGLSQVLSDLKVAPSRVRAIGDNATGDAAAPAALGVDFMHAKYGTRISDADRDFLKLLRPSKADAVEHQPSAQPKISAVADSYADLLQFINRPANLSKSWRIAANNNDRHNLLVPTVSPGSLPEQWR